MMQVMLWQRGRHACRLPTCRHHSLANPGMMQVMLWQSGRHLQVASLQASQPGKSWNDAGDAVAKGPACLQVANLQASQPGKSE